MIYDLCKVALCLSFLLCVRVDGFVLQGGCLPAYKRFGFGRTVRCQPSRPHRLSSCKMSAELPQLFRSDNQEIGNLEQALENCGLWSSTPQQTTMYLDSPETFHLIKGRVAIIPVTINGVPTGEAVEFEEGDFGIVPAGSYRWDIQKPCTKRTNCREGLQMTAKGWGEEPPLSYMRGSGTLSTKGRTSEDDLKYLKELIAEKGNIPRRAYEEAIQSKLDRDPYCANLAFMVTEQGIIVQDRVKGTNLEVLTEEGWEAYDPSKKYVETEGSKRWRKDGTFMRNRLFAQED